MAATARRRASESRIRSGTERMGTRSFPTGSVVTRRPTPSPPHHPTTSPPRPRAGRRFPRVWEALDELFRSVGRVDGEQLQGVAAGVDRLVEDGGGDVNEG